MKTYNIKRIFSICLISFVFFSCDSFLDIAEEQEMSFEKIWNKRNTIEKYLNNVWSFMPDVSDPITTSPFYGSTDEGSIPFQRDYVYINRGTWNPSNVPYNKWGTYYQGIREANIFMENIPEVNLADVSEDEKLTWYYEARFARAYYYYLLFQLYGPVMLIGDEPIDFTKPVDELYQQRNTLKECIEYIVSEMEACSRVLPLDQSTIYYGKPTKGVCYAVIAELRLYTARKLFNGNPLYKEMKNPDGSLLFEGIETEDEGKWRLAAEAAKRIIDMNKYSLYKVYNADQTLNPEKSYQGIFLKLWNEELIFARYLDGDQMRKHINPRVTSGGGAWGAYGPTQQQVDAYAMKNGRYPITGYNSDGSPIIDSASGYTETGFTNFAHPLDQPDTGSRIMRETYNMYIDREPRFYASVLWSNCSLPYLAANKVVNLAFNGNSGLGMSDNAPICGYLVRKYYDPALNNYAGQWGVFSFPIFRYAEILLNYVEALNEYDPSNPDILTYLNEVRERAGVPPIESVYPQAVNNKGEMRKLIRKERQVELAFETKRYFDTRTWMIATTTDNGPMWGMNVSPEAAATNINETPKEFFKRSVFETRVFEDKHYLYPFSQKELELNKKITQNYKW